MVAGPPGASGELAHGEALISIARLTTHAEPNRVLIAATTRQLVGGLFHCRRHAPLVLEDDAEPIETWTVESAVISGSRFDAVHAEQLSPFIGREAELGLLMDRWVLAQGGEGQAVLLCGEPGIGKSRMLKELLERLESEPDENMHLQCSPHAINSPYHPIIDNFEQALKLSRDETPEAKLDNSKL